MGAQGPDVLGNETTAGRREEPRPSAAPNPGESDVSSRSNQLIVYLPEDGDAPSTYHTSRLCSGYPTNATAVSRSDAESAGHEFCWTCFELEMLALED